MRAKAAHERRMWRREMTSVRYSTDLAFRQEVNAKWLAGVREEAAAGKISRSLFRSANDEQDTWDYTRRHTVDPDWTDSKERREREP